MHNRRNFLKKIPVLATLQWGGSSILVEGMCRARRHSPVVDKEIVFVDNPGSQIPRPVPADFIFSQFPSIPEVPETISVEFPWKIETTARFPERSLNGFGALNEGIYAEGHNILQIIPATPGAPDTQSGSPLYKNWYRISNDSGNTFSDFRLVVTQGSPSSHPIKGVKIGRNGYTTPLTSVIFKSSQNEILVPIHLHPWDEDKEEIYNPANAYLFGDSGVLIGRWTTDFTDIQWEFGEWLRIDHRLSTRGLFEPSVTELPDGRFAMVMRGSNYTQPQLPGYTWLSFSRDQCRTWSNPVPFTFSSGEKFFTPAACSTLFRSQKTNQLYWIGNLLEENSNGNNPRNPLVIGRVDEQKFGLVKESVEVIDHFHQAYESRNVELSNYKIMEHASRDEIVIALTRRENGRWAKAPSWYQIKLDEILK